MLLGNLHLHSPYNTLQRGKRGIQKLKRILENLKKIKRQPKIFLQNASIKLLRRPQACSWAKFTGTLFSGAAAFSAGGGGGRTPYTVSPKIQGRRGFSLLPTLSMVGEQLFWVAEKMVQRINNL
jgi:hypothetical protein